MMEEIDSLIEKSEILFDEAVELALKEIERIARKVLSTNKKLKKYTMAMGTYFFSYDNEIAHDYECKELDEFINKYCDLNLTGSPMSFTEKGKIITDW